jgi:hypothetical protein
MAFSRDELPGEEMNEMAENLAQKLAAARKKIGSLQPDKRNQDQKYDYISADKILEKCGDVLADVGIVIIPSVTNVSQSATERAGKSTRLDALVEFEFVITDGETSYTAMWAGSGNDYSTPDKAVYKAMTSGHKYFLMKLLNIGVGNEDGEHESEAETSSAKSAASVSKSPAKVAHAPEQHADCPPGNITPQMLVDNGLAKDLPSAAQDVNILGVAGKPAAEYWPRVVLYRKWRNAGKDHQAAAVAAKAGEIPQESETK